MRTSVLVLTLLLGSLIPGISAAQSDHAASQTAIDQALEQRVNETQAQRARVLHLLERAEVRAVAGNLGVDLRQAASAVSTLEGERLAELAAQTQRVDDALAGGQSITISTTLLILGLLLLIVLILALK